MDPRGTGRAGQRATGDHPRAGHGPATEGMMYIGGVVGLILLVLLILLLTGNL